MHDRRRSAPGPQPGSAFRQARTALLFAVLGAWMVRSVADVAPVPRSPIALLCCAAVGALLGWFVPRTRLAGAARALFGGVVAAQLLRWMLEATALTGAPPATLSTILAGVVAGVRFRPVLKVRLAGLRSR